MAIMSLSTRMVFWKIYVANVDMTPILAKYVESIRVKTTILPPPKNTKKSVHVEKNFPTSAEITVTSKNYIEDIFIEGMKIEIWMGYEMLFLTPVFYGTIAYLPEGNAKEMLNYTVVAVGGLLDLSKEQKRKTFAMPIKRNIIYEVLADPEYNYIPIVDIEDTNPVKISHLPIQNKMTDYEFLTQCAVNWNCVCWYEYPSTIYFVDAKRAHTYNNRENYLLGYKTDKFHFTGKKVPNNVEQISWKHRPPAAAILGNPGVFGFNEDGPVKGLSEYEIVALDTDTGRWATWRLNPELIKSFQEHKTNFAKFFNALYLTSTFRGYNAVRKYFRIVKYNDNTNPEPPPYADGGFDITVSLNEGDPKLFPPKNAYLYTGALNPMADTSHLPQWFFRYDFPQYERALLKVNETILSYSNGMLRSELRCTMSMNNL